MSWNQGLTMVVAASLCLWTAVVRAEPIPGTGRAVTATAHANLSLDFDAALDLASRANQSYRIAQAKVREAEAVWWQAVLRFGPTASLQASYVLDNKPMVSTLDFGSALAIPGLPGGGTGPQELEMATNYYSGALIVSQPLFTGTRLLNALNLADLQVQSARDERLLAWNQLVLDVTTAYYGLAVAETMLKVTEEYLAQTREHLDVVRARYRQGEASNYELLRSEVQLANQQPRLLKARNAAILAREQLAMTLGLDPGSPFVLGDSRAPTADAWSDLPTLQAQALDRRLELKNLSRRKRMAEIGHTLAALGNLPQLALTGTWNYYDTADQGFPPAGENLKHAWTVALALTWPIWDNLSAWPKAEEAGARVLQAELARAALRDGIRMEVHAAYLNLQAARETMAAQAKTIEQAEAGYRLAETQYASGLMTNLDVLDAQLALLQAKTNYLQARYDTIVAQTKLKAAVGQTLE